MKTETRNEEPVSKGKKILAVVMHERGLHGRIRSAPIRGSGIGSLKVDSGGGGRYQYLPGTSILTWNLSTYLEPQYLLGI